MEIVKLTPENAPSFEQKFRDLESLMTYPLGGDRFRIDHGQRYFSFFERLGSVKCYAAVEGDRVAAMGVGVLRSVPYKQGASPRSAWYLCDLKVHPDFRGRHLPLEMLKRAFVPNYLRCGHGYAISMNGGSGENRVARLLSRFKLAPLKAACVLNVYSLDCDRMIDAGPVVETHRGPISYASLAGKKDLILESTGRPMPLLHVQFGTSLQNHVLPQVNYVHMFCSPQEDPLTRELAARGLKPSATATVIQHRMGGSDWRFVLTSDI